MNLKTNGITASIDPIKYMGAILAHSFFDILFFINNIGIDITNKTIGNPRLDIKKDKYQINDLFSSHGTSLKLFKTTFISELLFIVEVEVNNKTKQIGAIKNNKLVFTSFLIP